MIMVHFDNRKKQFYSRKDALKFLDDRVMSEPGGAGAKVTTLRSTATGLETVSYIKNNGYIETYTLTEEPDKEDYEAIKAKALSEDATIIDKMNLYRYLVTYDLKTKWSGSAFNLEDGVRVVPTFRINEMTAGDLIQRLRELEDRENDRKPSTPARKIEAWLQIDKDYLFQVIDINIYTQKQRDDLDKALNEYINKEGGEQDEAINSKQKN